MRATVIADTHLVLIRPDGRILLLVREGTGYMDGHAGLPSGHVERGESADEAVIREAREETGLVLRPADVEFVHVMHRHTDTGDRVSFFFAARTWSGEPVNAEPHKCSGLLWADPAALDALPVPMVAYVVDALAAIRDGRSFSTYG